MLGVIIVGFILISLSFLFRRSRRSFEYFKKHGVPHLKAPHWFFGSIHEFVSGKVSIYDGYANMCNRKEVKDSPFFGFYSIHTPTLMVQDPELIKRMMVKDFSSFSERFVQAGPHDPLGMYNMFTVKGDLWRRIRQKFSPFFSSGKLKMMYYLLDVTGDEMLEKLQRDRNADNVTNVHLKDLFYLATTDIIARCAFGVDANSLKNPNNEFVIAASKTSELSLRRKFEISCFFFIPKLANFLRFKMFSDYTTDFIFRTVPEVMRMRRQTGVKRHDLIDTMIELEDANEFESVDILIAQAAVFFSAAHDTTSRTLTFSLYEMALNREIHDRARAELHKKLAENKGQLCYEMLMSNSELPYMHQIVMETLRKYPVLPFLERVCVNPDGYSLEPFSKFKIPQGMPIQFPLFSMCRSEKFFPEPDKFDPERFANLNDVSPYVFHPFGVGPRNCVGERLGLMAVKLMLAKILINYRIERAPDTPYYVDILENVVILESRKPIHLNFVKDLLNI